MNKISTVGSVVIVSGRNSLILETYLSKVVVL